MSPGDARVSASLLPRRGGLWAGALLVVVALGVIGVRLTRTTDRSVAADSDPVAVATRVIDGLAAFDVEAVEAELSDSASVHYWYSSTSPYGLAGSVGYTEATGYRFSSPRCSATEGPRVDCSVVQQNSWSAAAGHDGVEAHFEFDVVHGKVDRLLYSEGDEWVTSAFRPFVDYLHEHHPEAIEQLWEPTTFRPDHSPAALESWERYSNLFLGDAE